MIKLENYKGNIDLIDKYGLKNIKVDKDITYCGNVDILKKKKIQQKLDPSQPLAAAVIGVNNTAAPLSQKSDIDNVWTDTDAQELLLKRKPTCYLILSKPGAGVYSLGEALSKKLKCIHLCPHNIINDEIEQKSATGKSIDFNMKHNKVLTYDILMKMLQIKLESPAVQHRGYIISGFPLVTSSKSTKYFLDTMYGEEAVIDVEDILFDTIANLKKKKKHKKPHDSNESPYTSITGGVGEFMGEEDIEEEEDHEEELPEEEEELKVELPKFLLNTCSNIINPIKGYYNSIKVVLLQQVIHLFSLKLNPDIIIYVSCPDNDLVKKKSQKYLNYNKNNRIFKPFGIKYTTDIRWPIKYEMCDYRSPFDSNIINSKYWCKQPFNFNHNSVEQICSFKHHIMPFIKKKLQDFDPKCLIKLDAGLNLHEMMHNILERLLVMPITPVLIPEPLFIEEPGDDMEEFWMSIQNMSVIRSGVTAFNRSASLWYDRCPVELKKRCSVRGNPKLAVAFSKCVYLPATLDNMISFCRNPRPYLKVKYLEPTCRVIVIGTLSSGKTMISECLSWLFDTPVINYKTFAQTEKMKKYETYAITILSEIIATIEDARLTKWQNANIERLANLDMWCNMVMTKLKDYILLYKQYLEIATDKEEDVQIKSTYSAELLNKCEAIRSQLSFLPFIDDIDVCDTLTIQILSKYAPKHLLTQIKKPTLPVLGDDDVSEAINSYITTNDLQKDIEPSKDEIMNSLVSYISMIDANWQKQTNFEEMYGKYIIDGFPSDPECWRVLYESKLLPDYTISLIETREIEPELIEKYKTIDNSVKKHYERYMLAKDPLIEIKLRTKIPPSDNTLDMKIIMHDVIRASISKQQKENTDSKPESGPWASFAENIDKFKEEWDSVKIKLDEYNKCFTTIELENKSDVEIVEDVLLWLRNSYFLTPDVSEDNFEDETEENEVFKNTMTYNKRQMFGDTDIYCPISYYDYGVLWEGKPEYTLKFDNKLHRLCKEEFLTILQKDITKYQSHNKPFKTLPPLRVCVIGCIGSGKTAVSKLIAKELGLIHIDFAKVINDFLIPKHVKKVGRPYENTFTDDPIDEEAVVELQMGEEDENLFSNMLSNETELRKMVYNYFERGAQIHPQIMQKIIKTFWFQEPYLNTGFILDGYPRLPSDVEDMTSCFCIPDLIIEIEGSSEHALNRLSPKMINNWKMQLSEAKEKVRHRICKQKEEWIEFVTKSVVVKLICDEILDNMFFSNDPIKGLSNESVIIDAHPSGSVIDVKLFSTYNEIIREFPEPLDQSEWEKTDEARERIDTRIESIYETDDENIQTLKDLLTEHRINTVTVDGKKSFLKVVRLVLSELTTLRNRNESFFETTLIVNPDIAELLISEGLCYFSKFYRICPVHIYGNPNAIHSIFNISKQKDSVYTVMHRSYIYFICGAENVQKFRTSPLKYVTCNNIREYNAYPLNLSVTGAPKSGRSTLSAKLAKQYGLICLSRGIAVRYILENKHWTELATKMRSAITTGECINEDLIVKAIQLLLMDHRTHTNGFVLDGLPETASEAMQLAESGIYPNIIFDISAGIETVKERSQNEVHYNILKTYPPYSSTFIENRYKMWQEQSFKVRKWINSDYQNLYVLDGNKSKWQCWQDAVKVIDEFIPKVHYYLTNVNTKIVPADIMCISNETFKSRMSNFKNMCPLCLRKNVLRHNAYPVDKKGVVQYRNKFYWICAEHMNIVLEHPDSYLNMQKVNIPELPAVVTTVNMKLVYENGICIVTYAENLPAQKIIVGTNKYAATFQGKTYLFCNHKCLEKFLAKPHMYFDVTLFRQANTFPPLSLKNLPNIGYLEQAVANIITEACCSVNVLRPKYPGLSFQLSGLLYIGLYLKTHNPRSNENALKLYIKALKTFEARCKLLKRVALFLRSMDNPFAIYPKCCGEGSKNVKTPFILSKSLSHYSSSSASRVPVPDERYDYLVEYHKPASKVPAFLNVVDIAGLVKGAAEGQGLGNAFLSHIKACDAIFNLCRAFDDEDVIHVDGDVNPIRDLETIGEELRLKDEEQLMANFEKLDRVVQRGGDKKLKPEYDALTRIKAVLVDEKKHIRFGDWSAADIEVLNKYLFLTSKPALYLVNLSEKDYTRKKNKWLPKLKEWIDKNDPGAALIPFSGVLEAKLLEMEPEERKTYLKENNITSALEKIIVQGYKALNLEYFFTAGPDEVKAWTIQKGTKAPQAAGRIHTDFEKGFIMAEVMHYKDFKEEGSEAACKSAGKYRQQGRNYVVEDGDIIFFKFNAGAGLKDAKKK